MFEGIQPKDWVIVWATLAGALLGPFLAVVATRWVDATREARSRKEAVFTALMVTRRARLTPEHVGALNRIEVEFSSDARVLDNLRLYMDLMEERWPPDTDKPGQDLLDKRRRRALANLVQTIGQGLGRRVDRLDIIEGGYQPSAAEEYTFLQLLNARAMNNVLIGNASLPVRFLPLLPPPPPPPQPPPPAAEGPKPGDPDSPFPAPPPN